jgi:predicted phosphodiesterase
MSTVVFSDSHLTAKFDTAKFLYLQKIIEPADRVIINGDFWDGYMADFTALLNSEWSKLFALLNHKETHYVCGNHDAMALDDRRTSQFARSCNMSLELTIDGQKYHFEHGHRIAPTLDCIHPRVFQRPWIAKTASSLEHAGAWVFGQRFFIINQPKNTVMKRWQQTNLPTDQILVCGHSHWPELNQPKGYINTGCVRHHYAHHLAINNGQPKLISGRY